MSSQEALMEQIEFQRQRIAALEARNAQLEALQQNERERVRQAAQSIYPDHAQAIEHRNELLGVIELAMARGFSRVADDLPALVQRIKMDINQTQQGHE